MVKFDIGPCPICGAAHTACTGTSGAITTVMTPARDALDRVPLVAELVQPTLPAGTYTTGTYRRDKAKK